MATSFSTGNFASLFRASLGESSNEDIKLREEPRTVDNDTHDTTGATLFPVDSLFHDGIKAFSPMESTNGEQNAKSKKHLTNREELQQSASEFEEDGSISGISSDNESADDTESSEMGSFQLDDSFEKKKSGVSRKRKVNSDGEDGAFKKKKKKKSKNLKPTDGQKGKRKSKESKVLANSLSVRSIPCFYEGCTYSYKRPGSTIVEISDRPLLLPKKFNGFTIRSCKKHHDKWKHKEKRNFCDVCRGLNTTPESNDTKGYTNVNTLNFNLCTFCYIKQKDMLQLLPGFTEPRFSEVSSPEVEGIDDSMNIQSDDESKRCIVVEEAENSLPSRTIEDTNEGKGEDLAKIPSKPPPSDSVFVYRTSSVPGWNLTKSITYLPMPVWEASQPQMSLGKIIYLDEEPPFDLCIKRTKDDAGVLGLFTETIIPKGTCLGEFTGIVMEKGRQNRQKRHCVSLNQDLEIDASAQGNQFRFIGDAMASDKSKNVRFEVIDNSILVFATKKIKKNHQIFGEYGYYSEKEKDYIESFNSIYQFNNENLSSDELHSSAFNWFIDEGYKILHQKAKVTVPIEKRFPAKKNIANNHNIKRHSNVIKNETEWGYVAQLERLDLERAREDCWVTFKAGRGWNYEAFQRAVATWRKSVKLETNSNKLLQVNLRSPSPKKKKTLISRDEEKPIKISTVNKVGSRYLEEIQYSELSIKFDGALLGSGGQGYAYVFKGYWRGYPVAVRFPALKVPVTEDERQKFIDACSISAIVHPNIVTSYACCKGEKVCLVMELMNLGNLKQWLVRSQTHVHAMYIPRIALDIARGMEYIHSKDNIHGNLKSANVLIKGEILDQGLIANLEVKIGDLGAIGDDFSNKRLETEHFTAPECIKTRLCSRESDIYSFGKILCHLFSEGQEEPKPPTEVINSSHYLSNWDQNWKELIIRCTHIDCARRPNFSEILDSLTMLIDSSKL